nr:alpha/beta hydrolase [Janibacter limosus]
MALTPFGDPAGEGDSYRVNEGRDAYLRWRGQQRKFALAYAGGADLRDPLVSPVHADWTGEALPPAIFTTGTRDLFLSDTARIHTARRAAGGEADMVLAEGMWHSYLSDSRLPESARAPGAAAGLVRGGAGSVSRLPFCSSWWVMTHHEEQNGSARKGRRHAGPGPAQSGPGPAQSPRRRSQSSHSRAATKARSVAIGSIVISTPEAAA